MPAKPQSGRAIELGLALRIVSKRGRQVMFGQTGLLFANRQWVYAAEGNAPYRTASFPIAFPNGVFICVANICGYMTDTTDNCIIWNDGQTTTSTVQFRLNGSNTVSSPKCIAIGH